MLTKCLNVTSSMLPSYLVPTFNVLIFSGSINYCCFYRLIPYLLCGELQVVLGKDFESDTMDRTCPFCQKTRMLIRSLLAQTAPSQPSVPC